MRRLSNPGAAWKNFRQRSKRFAAHAVIIPDYFKPITLE